jgi:thiol:disulfide interchange protein
MRFWRLRNRFCTLAVSVLAAACAWCAPSPAADPAGGLFGDPTALPAAESFGETATAGIARQKPDRGHLVLEAEDRGPKGRGREIVVRLSPESEWHLYPVAAADKGGVGQGKPTLVSIARSEGLKVVAIRGRASAANGGDGPAANSISADSVPADRGIEGKEGVRILPANLELSMLVEPSADAPVPAVLEMLIGFQTCNDTTCDPPWAARLTAEFSSWEVGVTPKLSLTKARYAEVSRSPETIESEASQTDVETSGQSGAVESGAATKGTLGQPAGLSLPVVLAMGLAGGLILNLMPCVLPVLGLKLMAFAQQSGRARGEIFAMNLWYVAGLYAVFFVLATASVAANLGLGTSNLAWGEQFTSTRFNVTMCAIVFAFALSFLGVWELPIPGFIGEKAGHVQTKEGPLGAFLKGVLSTVLATPCSGPFLGPVFGFTLSQPTIVTYAVFGAIATGMALPYLVVGMLPGLAKSLPKPGAWMETLKEILGFVMLGTVVFLFTFLDRDWFIPTLGLLFGLWAACWWVGKAQETGMPPPLRRWLQAGAVAAAIGGIAFTFLGPVQSIIPWEPFSRARLAELRERGSTVMVDFSADWCLTCKLNLATAIETDKVKAKIDFNRVVPLLADWTEESDEIKSMLETLQAKSIPVLAIFPAAPPGERAKEPIILRDLISESQLLDALERAGPSLTDPPEIRGRTAGR